MPKRCSMVDSTAKRKSLRLLARARPLRATRTAHSERRCTVTPALNAAHWASGGNATSIGMPHGTPASDHVNLPHSWSHRESPAQPPLAPCGHCPSTRKV